MKRPLFVRLAIAFSCVALLLVTARVIKSCSDVPDPFDNFSFHPDVPLDKFAAGRLGLVERTFARSYLVVAYRYASGVPLTKDEQLGASALWHHRLSAYSSNAQVSADNPASEEAEPSNPYLNRNELSSKPWSDARALVASAEAPEINQMGDTRHYAYYLNCSNDAVSTAAATLLERIGKFGKEHPGIKAWVAAQEAVFANCNGDSDKPVIPAAAEASLPELLRFDREYQIAAAYMYSCHFDDAEKTFERIAAEKNSPWHEIAPYLVARNKVRRATLDVKYPTEGGFAPVPLFDPVKMQEAVAYVRTLVTNSKGSRYEPQLRALLDRAEFRAHPSERQAELSAALRKAAPDGRFFQWIDDYTLLLDRRSDILQTDYFGPPRSNPEEFKKAMPARAKDDLTDWIVTFQVSDPSATEHALEVWRAHRNSTPWLLAILSKAQVDSPFSAEVLAAADRIPTNSPAYITAFYHRMRLRNGSGNYKDVRAAIDALLAAPGDLPNYAKDEILDLRLDAAGDLTDATTVMAANACDPQRGNVNCGFAISEHSERYLDALPLDVLAKAVPQLAVGEDAQKKIARNVWMRSVLQGRYDVAQSLDSFVQQPFLFPTNPSKETIAEWIKQFESAETPEAKQFAAVFLLQHQYATGWQIGTSDSWCSSRPEDNPAGKPTPTVLPEPAFLTADERKQVASERALLDEANSQAYFYVRVALDFAQAHPQDPRVPEALSRAVKNTRMNCNNERTSALSKKAYDLLHQRYGTTSWAKNTKYWY
jgi:hypothetical protein